MPVDDALYVILAASPSPLSKSRSILLPSELINSKAGFHAPILFTILGLASKIYNSPSVKSTETQSTSSASTNLPTKDSPNKSFSLVLVFDSTWSSSEDLITSVNSAVYEPIFVELTSIASPKSKALFSFSVRSAETSK